MEIRINNKRADVTLDTEKTLGDVLSALEQWISSSGNRIFCISVNGEEIPGDLLPEVFGRDIEEINTLDLELSSWQELAGEALTALMDVCILYQNVPFEERSHILETWEASAAARFLSSDLADLAAFANSALKGEGLLISSLMGLIDERLKELADPGRELSEGEELVHSIAQRMEELPLDIQTGKDQRAAQTMQLFSQTAEKLFRLLFIFKSQGLSMDTLVIEEQSARIFMDEFYTALGDLSSAYEKKDSVMVGDLVEYELAPRLLSFYRALKSNAEKNISLASAS
ncbi:MAG: hypothetical protein FWH12_09210 [Treponema sp.]|nr:hypothetical protein [Treponema sp.]